MNNGKYNAEIVAEICGYLAEGETARNAASRAGIHEDTYYDWLNTHPEFSVAVKDAKEQFRQWENTQLLESAKKSLRVLIEGVEYDEVTTEFKPNPKDPNTPVVKQQKRVRKKILPSTTAVIFTLTNRDPENWKNRYSTEQDVKVQGDTETRVSLSKVPDDLLEQVVKAIRGESD